MLQNLNLVKKMASFVCRANRASRPPFCVARQCCPFSAVKQTQRNPGAGLLPVSPGGALSLPESSVGRLLNPNEL